MKASVLTVRALLAVALAGCGTLTIELPRPGPPPVRSVQALHAGAARADITPPPGYPTGGHSIEGAIARGWWTRLYARAVYLEDADGHAVAIVACDLWSISGGLADRTAELLAGDPRTAHLGREDLLLAATHTHHSPAGFSSNAFYSSFAGRLQGFDQALFEWLARRIAGVIADAAGAARPATLHVPAPVLVGGWWRNRSMPAFLRNPDRGRVLARTTGLPRTPPHPAYPDPDAGAAIDPRVRRLVVCGDGGALIAVVGLAALHPTAVHARTELYHGDAFGRACAASERSLRAAGDRDVVVALLNGAEGDVSPLWNRRDRGAAEGVAAALVAALTAGLDALGPATRMAEPVRIDARLARVPMADHEVEDDAGRRWRTAPRPLPGAPELGGAEDGRTALFAMGWREGQRGTRRHGARDRGHGAKLGAFDPSFDLGPVVGGLLEDISLTTLLVGVDDVPASAPIAVVRIGDSVLAGVPFEPTTTVGLRFEEALAHALGVEPERALLAGLAGEYIGYLTTPEEYDAQHYEGASTLYGGASAPVVGCELVRLATVAEPPALPTRLRYTPTPARRFGPHVLGEPPLNDTDGLAEIVVDLDHGRPIADPIRFSFHARLPDAVAFARGEGPVLPEVVVGTLDGGAFRALRIAGQPEDDRSGRLVTVLLEVRGERGRWATVWMPPPGTAVPAGLRLRVRDLDGGETLVAPARGS